MVIHNAGSDEEVRPADAARLADGVFGGKGEQARPELGHAEALLEADVLFGLSLIHI